MQTNRHCHIAHRTVEGLSDQQISFYAVHLMWATHTVTLVDCLPPFSSVMSDQFPVMAKDCSGRKGKFDAIKSNSITIGVYNHSPFNLSILFNGIRIVHFRLPWTCRLFQTLLIIVCMSYASVISVVDNFSKDIIFP